MHIPLPHRISLANLPTRIEKLERLSSKLKGLSIYIKRDDQTGMEWSGNKIRKLEYAVKEAIDMGCDYLITCGGNQSNHCRATAAVAARLGMKCSLVLRGSVDSLSEGNLFLDKMLGADIVFITADDYSNRRSEIMLDIKDEKEKKGHKAYIIPEGASNGIGSFGYYNAMMEIIEQEKQLGFTFDAIAIAVGSGGTYAGMLLAKKVSAHKAALQGYLVGGSISYFEEIIHSIYKENCDYLKLQIPLLLNDLQLIDAYIGRGYGLSTPAELEFIKDIAQLEGVIVDNVYTGKALYGLVNDIQKGTYEGMDNILFVHTGGMFELFSQTRLFEF